jgi:hypothetical protein
LILFCVLSYLDDGIPDATDDSVTSPKRLRLSSVHDIALFTTWDLSRIFPTNGDDPDNVILARRRLEAIHKYLTNGKNSFTSTTTMEMIVRANQDYERIRQTEESRSTRVWLGVILGLPLFILAMGFFFGL